MCDALPPDYPLIEARNQLAWTQDGAYGWPLAETAGIALAALDALIAQATIEYRCDKCGQFYAEPMMYHTPRYKRACCQGTLLPVVVLPFASTEETSSNVEAGPVQARRGGTPRPLGSRPHLNEDAQETSSDA
jgi:hypothetical protein